MAEVPHHGDSSGPASCRFIYRDPVIPKHSHKAVVVCRVMNFAKGQSVSSLVTSAAGHGNNVRSIE